MTNADVQVVADGLKNPRGLTFGPDGTTLYVAENGTGPVDEATALCLDFPPPPEDPTATDGICYGETGSIAAIDTTGALPATPTRVVDNLPSLAFRGSGGVESVGPADVSVAGDGTLRFVTGLGADPAERELLDDEATADVVEGMQFGVLYSADPGTGTATAIADIAAFEGANDPVPATDPFSGAPEPPDSNPHSVLWLEDRTLVADAGGNTLLSVDESAETPAPELAELFATNRTAEVPEFIGAPPGTRLPFQAVPTSINQLPNGELVVTQLTGFPFPVGEAQIYGVDTNPDTPPRVNLTGFTNVADVVQRGSDLFVLEFAHNGLLSEPPIGAVVRVRPDGTRQVLLSGEGLSFPGGIALGADGWIYLTNNGISPNEGQVLRFNPSLTGDENIQAACSPDAIDWPAFGDIGATVHEEAIACLSWWDITQGTSATAFSPLGTLSRAQTASLLARLVDRTETPLPPAAEDMFGDDNGSVHEDNINRLAAAGIILGVTADEFNPSGQVSRGQLASLVVRAYEFVTGTPLPDAAEDAFPDDNGTTHEANINKAAEAGWVGGRADGTFGAEASIQRDQASSVIARVLSTLVTDVEVLSLPAS